MPKITLFNAETVGVDMKTNPLFLGSKKLHSAVNLAFDEGVVRTRHGIRYGEVMATGCFQGVGEYRPARGISSRAFGESGCSLFVVVDGALYRDACPTGLSPFTCTGEVFIYQAENYLIFQSPETNTFWWDGTTLTESPGMNEVDWNDPSPQRTVVDSVAPVANIPACESTTGDEDMLLMFYVIDSDTQEALSGVQVNVYRNERIHAQGVTGEDGRWSFRTKPRTYTYTVEKVCYGDKGGTVVVQGNQEVIEVLIDECSSCEWDITSAFADSNGSLTSTGTVTVENTGGINLSVLSLATSCPNITVSPALPLTVPIGESAVFTITALSCELLGTAVTVATTCGELAGVFEPKVYDATTYSYTIVGSGGGLLDSGAYLEITNTGTGNIAVDSVSADNPILEWLPETTTVDDLATDLPAIIPPGAIFITTWAFSEAPVTPVLGFAVEIIYSSGSVVETGNFDPS